MQYLRLDWTVYFGDRGEDAIKDITESIEKIRIRMKD